ncbi:MAG: PorV/PorQ family protein, partial [Candidatus Cloacimonadota bacterium]
MIKKITLLAVLLLLTASLSFAAFSKLGTAGAQFLKIGVGARGPAMAGAFTAVVDDASALYWNPAAAANITRNELLVSDVEWVLDIRNNFFSYVKPMGMLGNIGFGLTLLTMGSMDVTTVYEPDGTGETFGASDIAATVNYSKRFTDMFSFGMNIKWIQQNIWDMSANGIAFDFGTLYKPTFIKNFKLAFVVENFGPEMVFKGGHLQTELKEDDWYGADQPVELSATSYA